MKTRALSEMKTLVAIASIVTLIATPFTNKDALIIPKVIVLFAGSMYLLPRLISRLSEIKTSRIKLLVTTFIILTILHLILVVIKSDSPLEQQIFGRTGRGVGLITLLACCLIFTMGVIFMKNFQLMYILYGLGVNVLLVGGYSISQSFGFDFFPWDSKTNGVIGTLGNPNFVSSFIAMGFIPTIVFIKIKKYKKIYLYLFTLFTSLVLFRAESLQGYIGFALGVASFLLIWIWSKNKFAFIGTLVFTLLGLLILILSSLNMGPMAKYFYKISVQSRGDFWRSAVKASGDNKFFGVGLDSFGDSYLKYRDAIAVSHPWAEYTDSAHNYFLDFLVSGGYPLLLLYILLNFLTLISFFKLIRKSERFNPIVASLFSAHLVFQAQALISPICIPLLVWDVLISGAIIGASTINLNETQINSVRTSQLKTKFQIFELFIIVTCLFITYPYFNADKLQFTAMKTGNADLAIISAKKYPESVVRYSVLTRELLGSGLNLQALDLARSAVNFNPNSPALWALILINPLAPVDERVEAKQKMLELDPLNKDILNFEIVE